MRNLPDLPKFIAPPWAKRAALAVLVVLVAAGVASADTVYSYTGSAFNDGHCLFGVQCSLTPVGAGPITLSFTETNPLPANLTGPIYGIMADLTLVGATPTSFSISDGLNAASGLTFSNFFVETDASGNIIAWNIGFTIADVLQMFTINSTGATPGNPVTVSDASATFCCDFQGETVRFVNNSPGTWTVQGPVATPEPASFLLVATGLALFGARWRKDTR
ncbi:MAG TPA: PEP-CTERM sorting domain-containing protein [Candidatus Acidoferrales bacterium]|nr:PEP-CTERM sorting domain-containing protein [Candidatus Acidoferrales bacterium]